MAKARKQKKSNRPSKYNDKLAVDGSFLDLVKAAAKNANSNSVKKQGKK